MNILEAIDKEIAVLKQARAILAGDVKKPGKKAAVTAKPKKQKRNLTPEGRAKIAAAVKARWARQKKEAKAGK